MAYIKPSPRVYSYLLALSIMVLVSFAMPGVLDAKELSKDVINNHLPENFVSVGMKLPRGSYRHLVGGFLIHPGVVLSSWHYAHEYYFDGGATPPLFDSKSSLHSSFQEAHQNQGLYVVFEKRKDEETKPIAFRVRKVIEHPSNYGITINGVRKKHQTIVLLFFEPTEEIFHIKPLPLVTSEDMKNLDEVTGQDLLGVGVVGYENSKPPDYPHPLKWDLRQKNRRSFDGSQLPEIVERKKSKCPPKSYTKLARMSFSKTPEEYHWMHSLIKAFPGRLRPLIHYKNMSKIMVEGETVQDWVDYQVSHRNCSETQNLFCTEPPPDPLQKNDLQFQCTEHNGYPVLWKTPSGTEKVLGVTAMTPFHLMTRTHDADNTNEDELIWSSGPPRSAHYALILAHPWIKHTIRSYGAQNPSRFTIREDILSTWDDFSERSLEKAKSQHQDFIVSLPKKDQNTGEYRRGCVGAVIRLGVVLTAAHCVYSARHGSLRTLGVAFRKKDKEYIVPAQKIEMLPSYLKTLKNKEDLNSDESGWVHDLALVFYEHNKDLPSISLPSLELNKIQYERKISQVVAGKTVLVSPSQIPNREYLLEKPKLFRYYNWHRLQAAHNISGIIDEKTQRFFPTKKKKKEIISEVENLSKESINEQEIPVRLKKIWNDPDGNDHIRACEMEGWLCAWVPQDAHLLEKASVSCAGNSGSPLLWKDKNDQFAVLGVHAASSTQDGPYGLEDCEPLRVFSSLSFNRNWIMDTLAKEKGS